MYLKDVLVPALLSGAVLFPCQSLHAEVAFQGSGTHAIIQDTGVANRLAVGQVLLSLTQEVPAAACHLHHGVNVTDAEALLQDGIAQVDELTQALVDGDIFWGIETPEERRKTLAEIADLQTEWFPVQDAARRVLEDPSDAEASSALFAAPARLQSLTEALLVTLDGQYSTSAEISSRDVLLIQLAGRMTTLNQQMALQACQLWSGSNANASGADLQQNIAAYQNTLDALSHGLAQLDIQPPKTPGIADKLDEIRDVWYPNQVLLRLVAADEEISDQQRFDLYYDIIDQRVLLLDLVYLYQDHSKIAY